MSGGFTVPFSSSLPSTPGTGRSRQRESNLYPSLAAHPSTTPAGPPPVSSSKSFTPAGPPPSTVFGSSQLGPNTSLFGTLSQEASAYPLSRTNGKNGSLRFSALPAQTTKVPLNDVGSQSGSDEQMDNGSDGTYNDGSGQSEDEEMEADFDPDNLKVIPPSKQPNGFDSSLPYNDWATHGESIQAPTSRDAKSFRGAFADRSTIAHNTRRSMVRSLERKDSVIPTIAKDLAKQLGRAQLEEADNLILGTEKHIEGIYVWSLDGVENEQKLEAALSVVPEALCRLWQTCCKQTKRHSSYTQETTVGIGPSEDDPPLHKATFISNLLLKLYHPPRARGRQAFGASRSSRGFSESSLVPVGVSRSEAYPKVLLDWLEEHHNPYQPAISGLRSYQPNPTAHVDFWDLLFTATLRGQLSEAIRILKDADFKYARTAREDEKSGDGYRGDQLNSVNRVVNRTIQVLELCPGIRDGDWHITDTDWTIYRSKVNQALDELRTFAEGRDRDHETSESTLRAENFGLTSTSSVLSRSARKAESKVPWTIYQNLKTLYHLLLGKEDELINFSQDWLEATIYLAVWWEGTDEEVGSASQSAYRQSSRRSQPSFASAVDTNPGAAYRRRLENALHRVTSGSPLQIDTNNPIEVGIASIFDGDVDGALGLLRAWSLPISAAVVEVATKALWYESAPGEGIIDGFNESDLMVLSYAQPGKGPSKDGILVSYAESLFDRGVMTDATTRDTKEGWQLSLQILNRLDDQSLSAGRIASFLGAIPVKSDERADKLISLCRSYVLRKEARDIAEKYAHHVAETSNNYGTALVYFARAHKAKKVKDVLDLLISFCLVQSIAYPPNEELDEHLSMFLRSPRASLEELEQEDEQAADILSTHMAGYATLRKFYDLRDQGLGSGVVNLRPIARRKAAASPLLMVIASAADNISGGLYDEQSPAIVPVDGLLVLLGEATVFLDQEPRPLTLPQLLTLLRAIEDIQTVHPGIFSQCKEFLSSTLASAHGTARADTRDLLKKSVSDLTASTGFSLVGSSLLGAANEKGKNSTGDGRKRAWDWRTKFPQDVKAEEILKSFRHSLAIEVSSAWIDGEEL